MKTKREGEDRETLVLDRIIKKRISIWLLLVLSIIIIGANSSYAANISINNGLVYPSLSLNKYSYFTNELITLHISDINAISSEYLSLELVNHEDSNYQFTFLGQLEENIPYITNTVGNYSFILYDYSSGSGVALSEVNFQVINDDVGCSYTMVGDEININIGKYFDNVLPDSLSIQYEDNYGMSQKVVYGGEMQKNIPYKPQVEGKYTIFADDNYLECYIVESFNRPNINIDNNLGNNINNNNNNNNLNLLDNVPNKKLSDFKYAISKKEDNTSKDLLKSKFKTLKVQKVDKKIFNDNSMEYDVDIEDSDSQNRVSLSGLKNIDELNTIEFKKGNLEEESLSTDIVYVNDINITNATVRLAKTGFVGAIMQCSEYDSLSDTCEYWEVTDMPFEDFGEYIEFTVPHFSAYAGVIIITHADILDENRTITQNIFDEVRYLDDVWSTIPDNHYVRVRFERTLNSSNDITIYARSNFSNSRIFVYEENKSDVIAVFENIASERYYKIFLNNLSGAQNTFDLFFTGGYIEVDQIIDPTPIKTLNLTLLGTYTKSTNPCSTDNAQQMARKLDGGFAYVASVADDAITILNISNPANITCTGSYTDSTPPGSINGAQGIKMDWERNLLYVCAPASDAFSIYNVTDRSNPQPLGSIGTSSTPPQTADGCREVAPMKIGNQYFVAVGAITDDYITIWNVTNPSITPQFLYGYNTGTSTVCSSDDVRTMEWDDSRQILITASYTDDDIAIFSVANDGTLTCLSDYRDNVPPQSVDGPAGFEYDNETQLLYVAAAVDDSFTILNLSNTASISYVGEVVDSAVLNLIDDCTVGDVKGSQSFAYCAILDTTAGADNGIAIFNVTDAANPVLLQKIDESFITDGSGCALSLTNYVEEHDGILYALSSNDDCFYAIKVYDYYYIVPNITNVRVSPSSPTRYTNIIGYCNASDDDNLYYNYRWYLNGALNSSGTTVSSYTPGMEVNVANISKSIIVAGQNWTLSCQADDTRNVSLWLNSTTVNVLPGSTPIINSSRISPSSPNMSSTLLGLCNATDADGDNLTYNYRWYLNGIIYSSGSIYANYTPAIEMNVANITSGELAQGQVWNFSCQAYDWETLSVWKTSTQITVIDVNPPLINFTAPTDINGINVSRNFTYINVTLDENASTCNLNWSGVLTGMLGSAQNWYLNKTGIADGQYSYLVICNDTTGNIGYSELRNIFIDTTSPNVTALIPVAGSNYNMSDVIEIAANVSDVSSISAVWVNVTLYNGSSEIIKLNFAIGKKYNVSFVVPSLLGRHNITYYANDSSGNINGTQKSYILVQDMVPPEAFSLISPGNKTVSSNLLPLFNWGQTVESDLMNYTLLITDDQTFTTVDYYYSTFEVTNTSYQLNVPLAANTIYYWRVVAYDNSGNSRISDSDFFYTTDNIKPSVILNSPSDNIFSTSSNVLFNYTPSDTNLLNCSLYGNFSGIFAVDQYTITPINAVPNNFTKTLNDGVYIWNVRCYDTAGQENFATSNFTINIDTNSPKFYNISATPTSPSAYSSPSNYQFNITWLDNFAIDRVIIEHNFSGTLTNYTFTGIGGPYSYNYSNLSVGTYTYKWYANDSANHINATTSFAYTVTKANSNLVLLLNGTSANMTINAGSTVNITALLTLPTNGNIEIYLNGSSINNGSSPLENIILFDTLGYNNVTVTYQGNENYTSNYKTYFINVTDTASPIITQTYPQNNTVVGSYNMNFLYSVSDSSIIKNCSLYINNVYNQTNTTVTKGVTQSFPVTLANGNYLWRVQCYDLYNNLGSGVDYNFTLIKSGVINLTLNSALYTYEIGANIDINMLTTDVYGGLMQASVGLVVVNDSTNSGSHVGWWNSSWKRRVALNVTANSAIDLYDVGLNVNITGFAGNITSCSQIRIIDYKNSEGGMNNNLFVLGGDNSNWCSVRFITNFTAFESNDTRFFVYYNNSAATATPSPYSVDYASRTCAGVWGFDCATGPPETGGDNTFDACANGIGNDESVETMSVNATRIVYGQTLNVTCVYDPYTSADDTFIWYYNGTGWRKLFEHINWGSASTAYAESVVFTPDNVAGMHWVRCGITYSTDTQGDECMNTGSYYDNDDVNFTVTGTVSGASTSATNTKQVVLDSSSNYTNIAGLSIWNWYTGGYLSSNYSILGVAKQSTYSDDSNYIIIKLIPDTTPPNIVLNAPINGFITNLSNITLNWTINDTQSNVSCNLTINGVVNQSNILSYKEVPKIINLTNVSEGTYYWNVTCIDIYGNKNTSETRTFRYAVPPTPFNLLTPANATVSSRLLPTFTWQQTVEQNFKNYTVIIDKDPLFGSPDYIYTNLQITNTSIIVTFALDANSIYYWRVIAYDQSGNSRNSNQNFKYTTDTLPPVIVLNDPSNNSFNNPTVFFNYTPADTNNITNCTLYGNFTGVWAANKTQNIILNGQYNNFTQTLAHGKYNWNIMCVDEANNSAFAPLNRSLYVDLIGPNIQLFKPSNNTLINETNNVNFTAQATDVLGTVDSCKLILNNELRQTKTNITDSVNFTFLEFVLNGNYSWNVNCTDKSGNEVSSIKFNLTVYSVDRDPPIVTLNYPTPGQVLNTENITFNYTAEDATGEQNCSIFIDDLLVKTNYTIKNFVPNYFTVNNILEAVHNWTVKCYDNSTEYNLGKSSARIFTVDLTKPIVILNNPPDVSFSSSSQVWFNYTPSDTTLNSCTLYGNFSGSWLPDIYNGSVLNGLSNRFLRILSDGVYIWNVNCNDSSGSNSFAISNRTIKVDTTPPVYSALSVSHPTPSTYSPSVTRRFNSTWSDNFNIDTVYLENNFAGVVYNYTVNPVGGVYSYIPSNLPVGIYYYKWIANDSVNNLAMTAAFEYNVTKSNSTPNLLLNGTSANFTIDEDNFVNITAAMMEPITGFVEIRVNYQPLVNGTSPLANVSYYSEPGTYEVTMNYFDSQNYTASSQTLYIFVNDTTSPVINQTFPGIDSFVGSSTINFLYTVADSSNINNCSLYVNNLLNQTDITITKDISQSFPLTLPDGNYSWRVDCYDIYGNYGQGTNWNFTLIKSDTINLTLSSPFLSYEIGYPVGINISTTDIFNAPMQSSVETVILNYSTTPGAQRGWWNSSWKRRMALNVTEKNGINQEDIAVNANITGLGGSIISCSELRIIDYKDSEGGVDIGHITIGGDGSNYCTIKFKTNLTSYESTNTRFFIYYNNSAAGASFSPFSVDYASRTCAGVWGFDCATGPPETGGDNTFDACANGIGNDESVETMSVNATRIVYGQTINVTCVYDPYTSADYSYIWYYNGTGWRRLFSHTNWGSGSTAVPESVIFTPDNVAGVHWVRCGIIYNQAGDVDECMNTGSYYDNDDVNFTVTGVMTNATVNVTATKQNLLLNFLNFTSVVGKSHITWNTANFSYGNYSVISVARKANFMDNSTFIVLEVKPDITPPNVTLKLPVDLLQKGVGPVDFVFSAYDINIKNCTLYNDLGGPFVANESNVSVVNNANITFANKYAPLGLHYWNVLCYDTYGNKAFAAYNFTLNITGPDLVINTSNIWFDDSERVEGNLMIVFANVTNAGLTANNESFIVQFYFGDPAFDGVQISGNKTVGILNPYETATINASFILQAGSNKIFVLFDSNDIINESNEANNKANNSIDVILYQYYYGNVTADIIIGTGDNKTIVAFGNTTTYDGHLFIADQDSVFSFNDLQALGRTKNDLPTADDFSEVDGILNTSSFIDSVNSVWTNDTNVPLETVQLNMSSKTIYNVPVVNTTNTTYFSTGILWDTSDDLSLNDQYDSSDVEDVVFVTQVKIPIQGEFGVYSYEIKVPAKLRDYKGTNAKVDFYYELK